jgi:hypothetical protein
MSLDEQRREEVVQGVLGALTRHEGAEQVREQVEAAAQGISNPETRKRLVDAVMTVVGPILIARDIVTERAESLLRITDRLAKTVAEQEKRAEDLQRQLDALRRHRSITEGFDNQDGLPR